MGNIFENPGEVNRSTAEQENALNDAERVFDLIGELDDLDFSNLEKVFEWLKALGEATEKREGPNLTNRERAAVVAKFATNGFFPHMNVIDKANPTDTKYDPTSKEKTLGYIFGQVLASLCSTGNFNVGLFDRAIADWKKKFSS